MNYQKYKILKFIKKCPDGGVPIIVIHNALNIDNQELEKILQSLLENDLIYVLTPKNIDRNTLYYTNFKSSEYIQNYPKLVFKALWEKYLFSIILSLIFFLLGLYLG